MSAEPSGRGPTLVSPQQGGGPTPVSPQLAAFAAGYGFDFDEYQLEACRHIEAGSGVLVAAPTGAGKTIVGEFAVHLALAQGRKCFYTTPIKALSNQKYADLVRRHGAATVGLLTGDSTINSEAPVVVMTTEVLRNMIYAGSSTLAGLGFVVMDEVHYLADRFRGAVWEEVIIGLAESIQVVALSATVSNAEEFGEWLSEVRGEMAVVVSERRPVPLFQHVLVGERFYDLFSVGGPGSVPHGMGTARDGDRPDVNPVLLKIAKEESRYVRDDARRPRRKGRGGARPWGARGRDGDRGRRTGPVWAPSRPELVELLDDEALLPAIVFIFSRVGCDAAVRQLLSSGITLTDDAEQAEISALLERRVAGLGDADLRALDYDLFAEALLRGVAAHHAGMLPTFKECVEEAFVRGLIKVVFATETLALGINMPARSVVLEKLVKYNGESHADVTAGEYTQLTGRAGRRGIDVEGHAVVVWQAGLDPRAVAGLASRRTYPLTSSFRPTYNMAVNLVAAVGPERARALLEQSFAQFQSDRSVVGVARTLARNAAAIQAAWDAAGCDRGDYQEYARLRAEVAELESSAKRDRVADRRADSLRVLVGLKPGDVVRVPAGKSRGWVLVLDPGNRNPKPSPRPLVLTQDRQVRRLSILDFPTRPQVGGRVKLGKHADPREPESRRTLAAQLRSKLAALHGEPAGDGERTASTSGTTSAGRPDGVADDAAERIHDLRARLRQHPCHRCPDREAHARWGERALQLERESTRLEARIASRTNTIAKHFDKICLVLESLGYLTGDGGSRVSDSGRMLARIYAELDLVAAECMRAGVFAGLTAPQLAAVLASLVYEARRSDDGPRKARMPDAPSSAAMAEVRRIWREVSLVERDARLERGPEPDIGFSEVAYGWAAGRPLTTVLTATDLTAGDFVRWVRQVTDFAGQIADAAGTGELRETAREVVWTMRRGVVTYAPEIDETEGDDILGDDYD